MITVVFIMFLWCAAFVKREIKSDSWYGKMKLAFNLSHQLISIFKEYIYEESIS